MKTTKTLAILVLVLALALVVGLCGTSRAAPLGTAFMYQNLLIDGNDVLDGSYDLTVSLFDDPNEGELRGTVFADDLDVNDGWFEIMLDFGPEAFDGSDLWLEFATRPGEMDDPNEYVTLWPRYPILPAPYALYSINTGPIHSLDAADGYPTEVVYVDRSGDVGIGTKNPDMKLHVTGTIYGENSGSRTGVYGRSSSGTGVHGWSNSGYAGYFNGKVRITGNLTKSAGSFKIDHPLDPENKFLQHSFVESPDMMNIYNGNVTLDENGRATIRVPDYFEALNRDFRYQLTAIGAPGPNLYIAEKISDSRFKIAGGKPGMEVSWQVTGIRHDPYAVANRIAVEEVKPAEERGYYLHPKAYGLPEEKGIETVRNPRPSQTQEVAKK